MPARATSVSPGGLKRTARPARRPPTNAARRSLSIRMAAHAEASAAVAHHISHCAVFQKSKNPT